MADLSLYRPCKQCYISLSVHVTLRSTVMNAFGCVFQRRSASRCTVPRHLRNLWSIWAVNEFAPVTCDANNLNGLWHWLSYPCALCSSLTPLIDKQIKFTVVYKSRWLRLDVYWMWNHELKMTFHHGSRLLCLCLPLLKPGLDVGLGKLGCRLQMLKGQNRSRSSVYCSSTVSGVLKQGLFEAKMSNFHSFYILHLVWIAPFFSWSPLKQYSASSLSSFFGCLPFDRGLFFCYSDIKHGPELDLGVLAICGEVLFNLQQFKKKWLSDIFRL